jgi:hypothetical protein
MSVIPALRKLRHDDYMFEVSMDFVVRPYLKKRERDRETERL